MRGRAWKNVAPDALARVRELLIRRGGTADKDLRNPFEAWRVRIDTAVFTGYTTGTIYCNGGPVPELEFIYRSVSEIVGDA